MKITTTLLLSSSILVLTSCASKSKIPVTSSLPATEHQKTSYAVGAMLANDLKTNGIDSLDADYIAKAFKVVFNKDSAMLTDEENKKLIEVLAQSIQAKKSKQTTENMGAITQEGTAFLEANKIKDGVVTTESGLQYKILKKGIGAFPVATDKVKVNYEGKLLNGSIFDSSFERGEPIEFGLNQVIKGWTEGMQYINEGGEIELYIPYDLAYGERGAGGSIPPYATLIFRVQLLQIVKEVPQTNPGGHGPGDGHNH